jgi:FimV-like protein
MISDFRAVLTDFVALAGALFVGGVIFLAYMRRRQDAKAESEKRTGHARRRRFIPVTHERRFGSPRRLCDHPRGATGGIFTEEMDTLAEVEIYLAQGRDADAEHILKDAITKDPARHELKFKLLAIQVEALGRPLNPDDLVSRADLRVDGAAMSSGGPDAAGETLRETAPRSGDRQWQHRDATKLELAKAYLYMNDTERALSLLKEVLARRAADNPDGSVVVQEKVPATADFKEAERRTRARRTQPTRRSAVRWNPKKIDRRQGFGRRSEDRA